MWWVRVYVCLCVCVLVTPMSPVKTVEPVDMPFGWVTRLRVEIPTGMGQFWGLSGPLKSIVKLRILWVCVKG